MNFMNEIIFPYVPTLYAVMVFYPTDELARFRD